MPLHGSAQLPRRDRVSGDEPAGGLLLDALHSRGHLEPEKPFRIDALTDTNNYQGRHTAAFSNDGTKLMQTDEWGGGTGPMCQASSMIELGGNTVITLDAKKKQTQRAYFKLPSAQSAEENCVSHNGGIIPVPGRDLYVQGWYQGGINIMDFTDPTSRSRSPTSIAGPSIRRRRWTCRRPRWAALAVRGRRQHDRRLVGGVLLERPDLLVRDRSRHGHSRAHAERAAVRQRDRGGQAGVLRGLQPAEPAEVDVAAGVRGGAVVSRPAGARPGAREVRWR
jgi:hypothetical protein